MQGLGYYWKTEAQGGQSPFGGLVIDTQVWDRSGGLS
jgi:hypothetical protein